MLKFFSKQLNNKKGFTLVELIVVIAILGILIAIAVPKFSGFRESAAKKADDATMAVIKNAARVYYLDPDNNNPATIEISDLTTKGLLESREDGYVPQQDSSKVFKITVNSGDIEVTVGAKE